MKNGLEGMQKLFILGERSKAKLELIMEIKRGMKTMNKKRKFNLKFNLIKDLVILLKKRLLWRVIIKLLVFKLNHLEYQ